jgi:hypothetical protein
MIVDFRYHVFTISIIFSALGLGILIGTSIIGNEGIIEEQRKIINNIGVDLNGLRHENTKLKEDIINLSEELNYREEQQKRFFFLSFKDRLIGREYVLIRDDLNKKTKDEIKNLFNGSGASLSIIDSYKELKSLSNFNRLILWGLEEIKIENIKNTYSLNDMDILICNNLDLVDLLLVIMESEINDMGEEGISNNSSLQ